MLTTVIDYNGTGFWSLESVQQRYKLYAQRYGIALLSNLSPYEHTENGKHWIYPVMYQVIEGIENGDPACAEIGIEFIEESASFTFGQILKSNTARALRRAALTPEQKERIRKRVVEMLCTGYLPREYRQYAKLARKIGIEDWLSQIEREADLTKIWVQHYYRYFKGQVAG
jgi:hypothetical protein